MVGRHRHLRRADEVEVLALDPVDVVGGLAEEAGALHGARPDQRGRDHLGEAGVAGLLHREVDQGELELGADAGEEVEARARHLGAALHVDGAEHPAELDVVSWLEALGGEVARGADRLEHREVVLTAGRRLLVREVGDRQDRGLPGLLGLGLRGLRGLHLGRELLGPRQQCLLLLALRLRDLLPERLLLAPLGLEVADRPAPLLVGRQRLVDHRVGQPALGLGGTHAVGLVTEDAGVDHSGKASRQQGPVSPEMHRCR